MSSAEVPRVLVVTNDFPPRVGGVQQYVWNLARHLPPERVSVLAPRWEGWKEHDASQPFAVHRWPTTFLWPTADLERRVRSLAREHRADVVLFGHGLPLPMIGPELARAGLPYVVLTHGAELWIARSPGLRAAMRYGMGGARAVTAVSEYVARSLRRAMPIKLPLSILNPGVDPDRFARPAEGASVRDRYGLGSRPLIVCVSRLVPRKGQDVLIESMALVRSRISDAALLVVGDGPYRSALEVLAAAAPAGSVVFAGRVGEAELPSFYSAADAFAMPCRSRWGGFEVEGFGIVYLEAAAAGLAVVAGRSGGAAEAMVDQETGLLVEGAESKAVALALVRLLMDPGERSRMGAAGRTRVEAGFTWRAQADKLAALLRDAAG